MIIKSNLFLLVLFNIILNNFGSVDFNDVMQGIELGKSIYNDILTSGARGIDVNSFLTNFEEDNRNSILFINYKNLYSLKNSKLGQMNGGDFDVFRDTYKTIEQAIMLYLKKSKADMTKEWNTYPSKADYILEKIDECLLILNVKQENLKAINITNKIKNNVVQICNDQMKDQKKLEYSLKALTDLESKVSGLTEIEKEAINYLKDNYKEIDDDEKKIEALNIALTADAMLQYKNEIYKKKNTLLFSHIKEKTILASQIQEVIKNQSSVLLSQKKGEKKSENNKNINTLAKAARTNNDIKRVFDEMNIIILTGNKSPGETNHFLPGLALWEGMREGGKANGIKGVFEGGAKAFVTGTKNLGKKIGSIFGF